MNILLPGIYRGKILHTIDPIPTIEEYLRGEKWKTLDVINVVPGYVSPDITDVNSLTMYIWTQLRPKYFFDENSSLEELSRAPNNPRSWKVTTKQEVRIIKLRKKYMMYGKNKLKVKYEKKYKETVSTWKIERVIKHHNLFPDKVKHENLLKKKAKNRKKKKKRIQEIGKPKHFGALWHVDTIIIYWYGVRRVIFTAIEDLTKIAYAGCYTSNLSINAKDFLERLMYIVRGRVGISRQDNGSEFEG